MKKLSFLALAAAGMLFGACSSTDDVGEQALSTEEIGEGYLALSINLPTVPQSLSRATDDNGSGVFDLDDGLESEYDVKSAYLLVFTPGASEDEATFKTAFLIQPEWEANGDPHVTYNSKKIVKKVGSLVAKNDLALVVLNPNSLFTFTEKNGTKVNEVNVTVNAKNLTSNATSTELTSSVSFGTFRNLAALNSAVDNASQMTTNGFYMTNSPLFTAKGSTTTDNPSATTFRTLVPIDNIYPTEEAAKSGTASQIFVERGMAKVTVNQLASGAKLVTKATDDADLAITLLGWTLDQTNTKSYMVRSTADVSTFAGMVNGVSKIYRFTGNTAISSSNSPGDYKYRGYFAIDPNYTGGKGELSHISETTASVFKNEYGTDHPQYCFENTFNVANQLRQNTTLVQLKVQVGDGATDLYTINGSTSSIYKKAAMETQVKNAVFNFLQIKGYLNDGAASTDVGTITLADDDDDATIQVISAVTVSGDKFKTGAQNAVTNDLAASKSQIKTAVGTIVKYDKGTSYYAIRIKHFGDELTPWHVGTKTNDGYSSLDPTVKWKSVWADNGVEATAPSAGNVYPDNSINDYLGRYGVLRNNWYDIQINSIKTLGSAKPINYTEDPTTDDELEGYINVQINILSWAKRTQNWDL